MTTRPTSTLERLRADLTRHTPATLAVYGLCAYVALVSLYNLLLGIDVRVAGQTLALPGDTADPIYELGTSLGFWGFLLFGLNCVLATRWRWVEGLFGGLDRVYVLHGLIGRWTLLLILLHLGILLAQALPDWGLAATYIVPGLDLSYTLGGAAVALLTILVAATLWSRIPYDRWQGLHRWMGVPYLLGGTHAIVAQGDWYLWLLTLAGGYAWLHSSFLYRWLGPRHPGIISRVARLGGVTELTIAMDRPHGCGPGQFVFLAVTRSAARLSGERHPFSLSALLDARTIRLSARALGDYTGRLAELAPGDRVTVYGPYGSFGERGLAGVDALWVAGGIGVTPFLSMLRHLAERGGDGRRRITFIWSVRETADAIYADEIRALAARVPGMVFHLHVSSAAGRLTAGRLSVLGGPARLDNARFLLCGPTPMMRDLAAQLVANGVSRSRIINEEFALR